MVKCGLGHFLGVLQNGKLQELPFFCFLNEFNRMFGLEVMPSQREEGDRKST